jgi:hypothetical protein
VNGTRDGHGGVAATNLSRSCLTVTETLPLWRARKRKEQLKRQERRSDLERRIRS